MTRPISSLQDPLSRSVRRIRGLVTIVLAEPGANVLAVTTGWPHDGDPAYGIFTLRQIESLRALGIRFDVLFIRGYRSTIAYAIAALLVALLNVRGTRYAVVHAHGGEAALAARLYVRAPVLASYFGDDLLGTPRSDGTFSFWSRLRRRAQRQHSRLMTATVTKSREMQDVLPPRVRLRNRVIPNGVDPNAFSPMPRDEARRRLGWPAEERTVLFVGDPAVPRKRYWLAEAACEAAAINAQGLRLRVISGVEPRELPLLMSAADCLLLTSVHEGSPNVVKEALMCNLPVVATRVGDVEQLLHSVEPSFVCEATEESLSRALVSCLQRRVRSNGRAKSQWLSDAAVADRVIEVYESLGLTRERGGFANRAGATSAKSKQ